MSTKDGIAARPGEGRVVGADRLEAVAAHRAAAAGIEAAVVRDVLEVGAEDRAVGDAAGEHEAVALGEREIGREIAARLHEGRAVGDLVGGLGIELGEDALGRVQFVVAAVERIGDRHGGDEEVLGAEIVGDLLVLAADASLDRLLVGQLVLDARGDREAVAVVGQRMLADRLDRADIDRVRPEHARLLEDGGELVVELVGLAHGVADGGRADARDGGVDAQAFGPAEEVAVAPIAVDARAVGVGIGRADAVIAELALADLDLHGQRAVGGLRLAFLDRDAGEDVELQEPLARLLEIVGREDLPLLDAGHVGDEAGIDVLGAVDEDFAEGHGLAGRDGEAVVERLRRAVGHDVAFGDGDEGPALAAQPLEEAAFLAQDAHGSAVPPRCKLGRVGSDRRAVGGDVDLSELEQRAGLDRDRRPARGRRRCRTRRPARGRRCPAVMRIVTRPS